MRGESSGASRRLRDTSLADIEQNLPGQTETDYEGLLRIAERLRAAVAAA
jgi:hypothetical protein